MRGSIGFARSVALALTLTAITPVAARAAAAPEELARFAPPTFLENLTVAADGAVYFTNYTARTVEVWRAGTGTRPFATLDAHPVSVLPDGKGLLVAVHGKSFAEGPAFIGTGRILQLGPTGVVRRDIPVPDAGMLNGMARTTSGAVLIADSVKGGILRFDPASGAVTRVFADPVLAPQLSPFRPGANGLKIAGDTLYVSSSAQRAVYALKLGAGGTVSGPLRPVLTDLPGVDDFLLVPGGGWVLATHADQVLRIGRDGTRTTLTRDPRVLGNTAVALTGRGSGRRVLVLGTGGFAEGKMQPAVLLALPLD